MLLTSIAQKLNIYCGTFLFLAGVLGGILNILVFLSLKTFRENSCAFYLTVMSFVNLGQLFTGLLTRIVISGFDIDWTLTSVVYCKFRSFFLQFCISTSFSCICLATIDQFLATCSNRRWQQYCHIRVAQVLTGLFITIWILHGIPYLLYYQHIVLPNSNRVLCATAIQALQTYSYYIYSIFFVGAFPIIVTIVFGSLAYRNVRQMRYRTVPLVRRELEKQLTMMILIQGFFNVWFLIPYVVTSVLAFTTYLTRDAAISTVLFFANNVTLLIYYLYFTVRSFYCFNQNHSSFSLF